MYQDVRHQLGIDVYTRNQGSNYDIGYAFVCDGGITYKLLNILILVHFSFYSHYGTLPSSVCKHRAVPPGIMFTNQI